MRMDHYSTLGVPRGASDEDIKKAYRKLAMQHHPDRGGDQGKFQQIQEAYATLSDPGKRQQYDNPQPQGFPGGGFQFHFGGGDPLADIFAQFGFAGGHNPFAHMQQQQKRNKDLRIELHIDLLDSLTDSVKNISVQTSTGERQNVQVNVPRGVRSGMQIRYSGLGDNMFNTLPRGDLYVNFILKPDPQYQVDGNDLIYGVAISCLDAITGVTIDIPTLESKVFRMTIPAGTKHGTRMRLPNQGLYELNTARRGNLIVDISLTIPAFSDPGALALVEQLKTIH
jgi:DnaJ-class molecular chaperone